MQVIARAGIRSLGVSVLYLVAMIVYWQLEVHDALTTTTRWMLSAFLLVGAIVWLAAVHMWVDRRRRSLPTGEDRF
jgi:hypothetical protein